MKTVRKAILACLVLASTANAATYDLSPVYSAGTGENTATIVVDFGLEALAFTYNWDGHATGWDAISAVHNAGDLTITYKDYSAWDMGMFVSDLDYPGVAKYDFGLANKGWAYWSSEDGENWYTTWGVSSRDLQNSSWDVFLWSNYDENYNALRFPGQPVPEPLTVAMLALGGLLLRRRSRN